MLYRYYKDGLQYEFTTHGNNLLIRQIDENAEITAERIVKAKEKDGYSIFIRKTYIGANEGLNGIISFIGNCIRENFMTCYIDKIIKLYFYGIQ